MNKKSKLESQLLHHIKWLKAILKHNPKEIVYDEFAYKRLIKAYRKAAKNGLASPSLDIYSTKLK